MTVVSVAFVPSAPLLVPAVAGGSAVVDAELRSDAVQAVARAIDGVTEVVVVAATTLPDEWGSDAVPDFSGFGVAAAASGSGPRLPWPLGIGAWLLDECGWHGPRHYVGVVDGPDQAPVATSRPTAVIAVGDGSACRIERAPGYLDPRAQGFDDAIAEALARGDVASLTGCDRTLADDLLCRSLPVWRWIAAMIGDAAITETELVSHTAPYGVGYFVAGWSIG